MKMTASELLERYEWMGNIFDHDGFMYEVAIFRGHMSAFWDVDMHDSRTLPEDWMYIWSDVALSSIGAMRIAYRSEDMVHGWESFIGSNFGRSVMEWECAPERTKLDVINWLKNGRF